MPFDIIVHPSPALSCLAGALREKGIKARCRYFCLGFAEQIGLNTYFSVLNHLIYDLLGDWIFSKTAFPWFEGDDEAYLKCVDAFSNSAELPQIRDAAAIFIDRAARETVALGPSIVGCSSTLSQNCASLAFLRRIRELSPSIVTIMGGANCEGEMGRELHRNFTWVDYVLSGEGDVVFPEFCRKILDGEKVGGGGWTCAGLFTPSDRHGDLEKPVGRAVAPDMSRLPDPWHDDYFFDLSASGLKDRIEPGILMETSRGCWWGEKNACTFCGLNGLARAYRSKTPERAVSEIERTAARYGMKSFQMTDNILKLDYFDSFLPKFKNGDFLFLYEVSPILSRKQVEALSDSGVRWVQPGIEHLHDAALAALGKTNRAYHNIRFLKWAREYGVAAAWNFLYGFPGEDESWHDQIIDLIPLLTHLQPPAMVGTPLRFDRFSRYHYGAESYRLDLKPYASYSFVYPLGQEELSRLAYFFEDAGAPGGKTLSPKMSLLLRKIYEWKYLFPYSGSKEFNSRKKEVPMLGMSRTAPVVLTITDSRPCALASRFELSGLEAEVYDLCDAGLTLDALTNLLPKGNGASRDGLLQILDKLISSRILVEVAGRYLSLAVNMPYRDYLFLEDHPGGRVCRLQDFRPDKLTIEQVYGLDFSA
jgi:magnesium-protoporphyrin IX monomethyl ester (oxidative) cyclase